MVKIITDYRIVAFYKQDMLLSEKIFLTPDSPCLIGKHIN